MLTTEEKAENRFNRFLDKAKEYQLGTYLRKFVARDFQLMIRAEASLTIEPVPVVLEGEIWNVSSPVGQVACVTCGKVGPWRGGANAAGGGMHTGHFIASRCNSIVLEENNVAPQCARCNLYGSGQQEKFALWMRHVRGEAEIERLRELKQTLRRFTREELVSLRIGYLDRLKAAIEAMN